MKLVKKIMRKIMLVLEIALVIVLAWSAYVSCASYHYLKEYGYGKGEIPKVLAVYYHLSDGFTLKSNKDGSSEFIGNADFSYYQDTWKPKRYQCVDREGQDLFFETKVGTPKPKQFEISTTKKSCHWFGIYLMSNGQTIENAKE
ncbi:MAG: hypothetical protein K6G64_00365 [Eubacterium sp.]|nr:hypothetical protein [Eubacterium sp.]